MKKIYYFVGILIIITVAFLVYFLINKKVTTPSPTADKIIIQTPQGELPIADVKKDPVAVISPNDTLVQSTAAYDIVYFDFGKDNQSFLLYIKDPDFKKARIDAEAYFLQKLAITQKQACLLKVALRISKNVDENLSGQEFGLSFCPGGKPFK